MGRWESGRTRRGERGKIVSGEPYDEKKTFETTLASAARRVKRMAEKLGQENPNVPAPIFLPETLSGSPGTTTRKPNHLPLTDGCAAGLR